MSIDGLKCFLLRGVTHDGENNDRIEIDEFHAEIAACDEDENCTSFIEGRFFSLEELQELKKEWFVLEAELKEAKEEAAHFCSRCDEVRALFRAEYEKNMRAKERERQAFDAARKTPGDNLRMSNELFGYYVFHDFEHYLAEREKKEEEK